MKNLVKIPALIVSAMLVSFTPTPHSTLSHQGFNFHEKKNAIKWKSTELDLGSIEQNKPASIEFEFVNSGEVAIIITNVQAGCGCTATSYSKEPIAPGQSSKITATYNAANKGTFLKTVTVTSSAEPTPRVLTFKGTVI
ncbi:MAG: DUF1573 domain-containing protein [Bacteroidia bacterium]|nr:DUF1573 domain-containing protein [Bacteroidia bacterium]